MADRYWVAGGTGNYNSTTNWSATSGGASGASVPTAADNVFFNAASGAGTATINVSSACFNLNLTGFTGALVFTQQLNVNGTTLNFGTGGYTVTGAAYLRLLSAMTITSNGSTYTGNIEFPSAVTITLADNMSVSGDILIGHSGTVTLNGNTLNVGKNLTHSTSGTFVGTTIIVFNGTGTWNHTSTGFIRNNITVNTSGTLTLGAAIRWTPNSTTFTYIAGTVITTGNYFALGTSTWTGTMATNGITFNDIGILGSSTITLANNLTLTGTLTIGATSTNFILGGNSLVTANANLAMNGGILTLPANQTFKSLSVLNTSTITNNTLTITENLTINPSVSISGTTSIVYAGTGTWTAGNASSIINNTFTINTSGTLTILGAVYKSTGAFTYTAGTIIDTGATVVVGGTVTVNISGYTWEKLLVAGAITLASNINAVTFGTASTNNVAFTLAGNTLNFTHLEITHFSSTLTLPTAWVCQDITFANISGTATINAYSITVNGNINQNGTGNAGTTTFTYAGTGTWSRTGTGRLANAFTINTAGTLTFSGGIIGGGIFTYTAGTVNVLPGSILYNNATGTTFNHGNIQWYDVVFNNVTGNVSIINVVLNNKLICTNTFDLGMSNTTFSGTDATFDVYNLIMGSDLGAIRTTSLASTKTYRVRQSFTATVPTAQFPILLKSTVAASQAIFTLDQGATIDVGFVNATDINSSLGRRIYSYRGVLSNATNWALLPTDVKPATGVFVN
jgi:hypothetical protein